MMHMSSLATRFPSQPVDRHNIGKKSLTKTNVPSSGLHEMKTILFLSLHQP